MGPEQGPSPALDFPPNLIQPTPQHCHFFISMTSFPSRGDLSGWTRFLGGEPLPILRSTHRALQLGFLAQDHLVAPDLSVIVLRDPLLTIRLLRFLQEHRSKRRQTDITTVEHAIMMLGVAPFFQQFSDLPILEEVLSDNSIALEGAHLVAKRGYVASRLSQHWAALRMDTQSEEVQVAALIRDAAELLLWIKAPAHALLIKQSMLANPALRSAKAQQHVLGFPLLHVEQSLSREWGLPELFNDLLEEHRPPTPRMLNVQLALRLTRHSAISWDNPALPDDWKDLASFLGYANPLEARDELTPLVETLVNRWDRHNAPPLEP